MGVIPSGETRKILTYLDDDRVNQIIENGKRFVKRHDRDPYSED